MEKLWKIFLRENTERNRSIKQIVKNILADIVIRTISAQDIFDYENAGNKSCLFSLTG